MGLQNTDTAPEFWQPKKVDRLSVCRFPTGMVDRRRFRQRVKMRIEDMGKTMLQVEQAMGFSRGYLSRYLDSRVIVVDSRSKRLAAELNWTVEQLFDDTSVTRPPPWEIAVWYWDDIVSPRAVRQLLDEAQARPGAFSSPTGWGERLLDIQEEVGGRSPRDTGLRVKQK